MKNAAMPAAEHYRYLGRVHHGSIAYPRTVSQAMQDATIYAPAFGAPVVLQVAPTTFVKGGLLVGAGETYYLVESTNPHFQHFYYLATCRAGAWQTTGSRYGQAIESALVEKIIAFQQEETA